MCEDCTGAVCRERKAQGRMIKKCDFYGIRAVVLSNDKMQVRILPGKGADIYQILLLPEKVTLLYNQEENLPCYQERNLYQERLQHYSQDNIGGWQDVVPGYGRYGNTVISEKPVGIAATVGWKVMWEGEAEDAEEVCLSVDIPDFPLHLTKWIGLNEEGLYVKEQIRNDGTDEAAVTWTQHSAFGGNFLAPEVAVIYPGEKILLSSLYASHGGCIEEYVKPIKAVSMPDGTVYDMTRMRPQMDDGQLVFTMKAEEGCFGMFHEKEKVGFRMKWEKEIFPYIRCWYRNDPQGYALAVEPCNYYYSSFADTDRDDMYLHLKPGEAKDTTVLLEIVREG